MPNKRKRLHYFLISGLLFVFIFGSLFWILNQETSAQPLAERSGIGSPPTFDLQITKSATPTSGPPGTTVTYTIVFSNNGPQIANDLIISDTLPPAFIVGQVDTGGDFVTQTITPTLSWSYPTLNAGERDSLTLTGIFSGPFTSGPVVTNTAVITQSPNRPLPVLMAGGQCPANEIDINGSDITFVGNIHSNGDVQSTGGGGVGVTIFGYVYHNTGTNIPNTNTTISPTIDNPVQSVPRNYLIDYNYADFVPASEPYSNGSDGWAYTAIMAFNPAHYHYFPESTGDVTMADLAPYMNGNQLEDGVYVTPVGFKFSGGAANGLIGDGITFVTRGEIDFSGSGTLLQPYFNGLLMVTDGFIGGSPCDNNAVVKLSGSNWDWGGIIFAPNGGISFGASSNLTFIGSLIGAQIDISGSNLYFTADQQFKPVDSNPSNNTAETPFNLILPPTFDLEITKSVTPTTGLPGTAVTYTLTISNNGPLSATNLLISDILPPELISVQVDTGGAFITQSIAPNLSWSYPLLNPGQRDSLTITGIISPAVINGPTITNTADIYQSIDPYQTVIMAGGSCPSNDIDINGSQVTFLGNIHSNGDIQVTGGGQGNVITGFVTHGTGTNLPNPNTTLSPTINNPSQVPPRAYPIVLEYADFVSATEPYSNGEDGWAYLAIMAANPAHYHYFPESGGDVTISDLAPYMNGSQLEEGVYVTPVGFDLSGGAANGLIGSNVTFITRGEIDFSGSNIQLNPYFSGLLFLTDGFVTGGPCDNNSVIKFSGSNSSIGGIWFAPNGQIGVTSSSDLSLTGSLIAGQVDVSGSNLYLEAFEPDKPDENDYSNNTAEAIFTLIIPYPTADSGGPYVVNEGSTVQLDASASSGLNLSAYDWDLDNDGLYDDASGITVTFDNTADNAIYPIGLQVSNSYGLTDTAATTVTVNNVPPSLTNLSTNTPITESQALTLTGAIIDPGSQDNFTITVDWADGQQDTLPYPANTIAFTITHQYLDNPPGPSETYTISLDIEDKDGGSDSAELPIQVHNSPPTVNAGPDQEVLVNIPIQVSGTFTDLSPLDTHTITWDFGDGTTITGSLTTTHTYETAGNYTVTLTIIDDDGGLGSDSLAILVSNHSIFIPAAIHQPVSTTTVSTNSADLPKTGAPGPMLPNNNKRPIHVMLKPEIPTL